MTVNIQYNGHDISLIYENPALGGLHANVNYQSAGTDIANTFTNYNSMSVANGNIATRIPPTGVLTSAGNDLSNIFAGNPGQYTLTSLGSAGVVPGTAPQTITTNVRLTFGSSAALTSFFLYGGRIIITPSQSPGTVADTDLQAMFTQIGTVVVYDQGSYITGAGGGVVINNSTTGGSNATSTVVTLLTATEPTTYTSNTFVVKIVLTSATILTITTVLTLTQHGTVADNYTGTYTIAGQARTYSGYVPPTQVAPTAQYV